MTRRSSTIVSVAKNGRWARGGISSPLHRMIRGWVLCSPDWAAREKRVVEIFGTKRRRTNVMKEPAAITVLEIEALSSLMNVSQEAVRLVALEGVDPSYKMVPSEANESPIHTQTDAIRQSPRAKHKKQRANSG